MIIKYQQYGSNTWNYKEVGKDIQVVKLFYHEERNIYSDAQIKDSIGENELDLGDDGEFAIMYEITYKDNSDENKALLVQGTTFIMENGKTIDKLRAVKRNSDNSYSENKDNDSLAEKVAKAVKNGISEELKFQMEHPLIGRIHGNGGHENN